MALKFYGLRNEVDLLITGDKCNENNEPIVCRNYWVEFIVIMFIAARLFIHIICLS